MAVTTNSKGYSMSPNNIRSFVENGDFHYKNLPNSSTEIKQDSILSRSWEINRGCVFGMIYLLPAVIRFFTESLKVRFEKTKINLVEPAFILIFLFLLFGRQF